MNLVRSFKAMFGVSEFHALTRDSKTKLPLLFNAPIMDYSELKVWCKGIFEVANSEQIKRYPQNKPQYFFRNTEPHGWGVALYSLQELKEYISKCKPA